MVLTIAFIPILLARDVEDEPQGDYKGISLHTQEEAQIDTSRKTPYGYAQVVSNFLTLGNKFKTFYSFSVIWHCMMCGKDVVDVTEIA